MGRLKTKYLYQSYIDLEYNFVCFEGAKIVDIIFFCFYLVSFILFVLFYFLFFRTHQTNDSQKAVDVIALDDY